VPSEVRNWRKAEDKYSPPESERKTLTAVEN